MISSRTTTTACCSARSCRLPGTPQPSRLAILDPLSEIANRQELGAKPGKRSRNPAQAKPRPNALVSPDNHSPKHACSAGWAAFARPLRPTAKECASRDGGTDADVQKLAHEISLSFSYGRRLTPWCVVRRSCSTASITVRQRRLTLVPVTASANREVIVTAPRRRRCVSWAPSARTPDDQ